MGRAAIRVLAFAGKELREVLRQPRLVIGLVAGPILILLLFGIGFRNQSPTYSTVLAVPPGSGLSLDQQQYQQAFGSTFQIQRVVNDPNQARQAVVSGTAEVGIAIPVDAYQQISSGHRAQVQVFLKEIDPLQDSWVRYFAYVAVTQLNHEVLTAAAREGTVTAGNARQLVTTMRTRIDEARQDAARGDLAAARQKLAAGRSSAGYLEASLILSAGILGQSGGQTTAPAPAGPAGVVDALARLNRNLAALDQDLTTGQADTPRARQRTAQIDQDLATLNAAADQMSLLPPEVLAAPFESTAENLAPVQPSVVSYYAPGILALLIQHLAVTLTALSLVRERLQGSVELFRVAPTGPGEVVLGKFLIYAVITLLMAVGLRYFLTGVLGVPLLGASSWFWIAVALLALASLGVGFFISSVATSESQAVQLSMLVLLASVFFSGLLLPLYNLLQPVRVVSYLLPVTYGLSALQEVMLAGDPVRPVYLLALVSIGLVLALLSVRAFAGEFRKA